MFRSWWKKVITLLIAILFTVAVFLAWTSYNFSRQYRDTLVQENSASLKMWSSQLTSRVNAIYEHIYELLITLYNNTELRSDTPIMNARTKIKIILVLCFIKFCKNFIQMSKVFIKNCRYIY